MLDVFYVTFMLLGFLLYLRGNYFVCGIVMGLSILCKVTALLGILAILLHWALTRRHEIATEIRLLRNNLRDKNNLFYLGAFWDMGRLFITTIIVWIVLLPLLEYPASHQFTNPISRTFAIFRFHIDFNAIHRHDPGIINKPWTWISNHTITLYYRNPLYLASINWNIWIFIIPSMLYLTYEVIRYRQVQHSIAAFALSWFFGLYLFLIPLEFITGRMMFIFYLYPAIPAVCLAIAWCAWRLWCLMKKQRKSKIIYLCILAIYIYSAVVSFFLLSPLANHLLYR
jgi:hypothetical protein